MNDTVEILRLYPFSGEGHAVAGVTIQCGPMAVRAKLYEKDGRRWLSMPARKGTNNDVWYEQAWFVDRSMHDRATTVAFLEYDRMANLPAEEHAPHPVHGPEPALIG